MSASRRAGGGDESILAKLERDARKPGRKAARPLARLAWLTLAGGLILVLIGALVWLAQENRARHQPAPLADESKVTLSALAASGAPQHLAAAITDEHAEPPKTPMLKAVPSALPPLVKLQPPKPAQAAPAAPVKLQPMRPAPSALAAAAKPQPAKKPAPAVAPSPLRTAAARNAPPPLAARNAPPPLAARSAAPIRPKKTAPAGAASPKAEAPPVDSDIALLSAIIMQSSSHAAERAQQQSATGCAAGPRKCLPRGGTESEAAPKTTD